MISPRKLVRAAAKVLPASFRNRVWRARRKARLLVDVASEYSYDFRRFLKWSAVAGGLDDQVQLRSRLITDCHKIEKGLSLRSPRPGFGARAVDRLISNLRRYVESFDPDGTAQAVVGALSAYHSFNLEHGFGDEELGRTLAALEKAVLRDDNVSCVGGVKRVTKVQIHSAAKCDLRPFFESRHSIRDFTPDEVDIHLIERAVALAQKTPSVCNRQSWKVYVFSDEEDRRRILDLQHGNRGFGDKANKVLVVTAELGTLFGPGERNQGWIDGGMFAMSLVYALHSLGLGACCLNWCVKRGVDVELRQITGISNSESVLMMIVVGHLPDELCVAHSARKDIGEVLVIR